MTKAFLHPSLLPSPTNAYLKNFLRNGGKGEKHKYILNHRGGQLTQFLEEAHCVRESICIYKEKKDSL